MRRVLNCALILASDDYVPAMPADFFSIEKRGKHGHSILL